MSACRAQRPTKRRSAKAVAVLAGFAALTAAPPSSASTAMFFPRGSNARVERHHVTVAIGAKSTITWSTIDLGGDATDVGVLVAVKAGGRVELTARTWIDLVEEATRVVVSSVPAAECKPLTFGVGGAIDLDGGASVVAEPSGGGCSGGGSANGSQSGGGGCYSKSSSKGGGCNGCSCEPSEEGHPGCSAFAGGCAPASPSGSSSGGSADGSTGNSSRVGPYDLFRVRASDGSALGWLDANGYDPGVSFTQAVSAVEADGYELYAVRARAETSSAIVRFLRVVTTSPAPAFPLRLLRTGASSRSAVTPLTLVVLASSPQRLLDTALLRIDESRVTSSGSTSNYESLVSALLGVPEAVDAGSKDAGGADGGSPLDAGTTTPTRWLLESGRTLVNRPSPRDERDDAAPGTATLADIFRAQCKSAREVHAVCGSPGVVDGGAIDAAVTDASADAATDGGNADGGTADGGTADGSAPGCADVERERCDDLDLAIVPNGSAVATRFRAVVGGDPASMKDVVFAATTDAIPAGRYVVRNDGQPGLCEATADADAVAESDSPTCTQTQTHGRGLPNFGPAVLLLVAIRAVTVIMRRARRGQ